MKRILITGMSGTGKSSAIEELNRRGYLAIDLDSDEWCEWKTADATPERLWREDKVQALLGKEFSAPLFVSGCESNQGKFYPQFDYVVLLSAPLEALLGRVAKRTNNPYGKSAAERDEIIQNTQVIEPLLRSGCDFEIDTAQLDVQQVADKLIRLANNQQ
jgi:RNase adaptor protein for sRNA GlmZ degradation